jgi:hypothetical protein
MDAVEYKEMAVRIKAELESLEIQQEDIERRIARLKQALIGLIPLSEPPADSMILDYLNELTLTDATRQILQAAEKPLTPTEIKQQLLNMGRDLSGQKNVMASIHSLLKRLVSSDEIESRDNGLTYQWKLKYIRLASLMGGTPIPPTTSTPGADQSNSLSEIIAQTAEELTKRTPVQPRRSRMSEAFRRAAKK